MLERGIIIIRRRRINRNEFNSLWWEEIMSFIALTTTFIPVVLLQTELIQAHCSFYDIWHVIKLKTNVMQMTLEDTKKVVGIGISMSNLSLWSTVSQRNGLVQWYKKQVSVWTVIMSLRLVHTMECLMTCIVRFSGIVMQLINPSWWRKMTIKWHNPLHMQGHQVSILSESQRTVPHYYLEYDTRFVKSGSYLQTHLKE